MCKIQNLTKVGYAIHAHTCKRLWLSKCGLIFRHSIVDHCENVSYCLTHKLSMPACQILTVQGLKKETIDYVNIPPLLFK